MSLKEFRIIPGYTKADCCISDISLRTPLCCDADSFLFLSAPFLSAAMQAVTGVGLAIALAQLGGVGVLPVSQSVESQCDKLRRIKRFRAGFQTDILTFRPDTPISDIIKTKEQTGYSIFPVTDTGLFHGKLLGVISDKDFDPRFAAKLLANERMKTDIQTGVEITDLKEANRMMIHHGRGFLPIVSQEGTLQSVVFKKDLDRHIEHPEENVDCQKRFMVGAAISTHPEDRERSEELIRNGVDFLVIDASDGHTEFQVDTLRWLKKSFSIPIIAGNIVSKEAFTVLANAGADSVKIGMGIGSGCTTQEVKATGRGQATAIMEIAQERDAYSVKERYIPLIADGGISSTAEMAVALALGADSLMMGNFFARYTESEAALITNEAGETIKEYWMEGTYRAFNNRRYSQTNETFFEEGIAGYVPHIGSIYNGFPEIMRKLRATLSTVGVRTVAELHEKAVIERISAAAKESSEVNNMQERKHWGTGTSLTL